MTREAEKVPAVTSGAPFANKAAEAAHQTSTTFSKLFTKRNLLIAGFVVTGAALGGYWASGLDLQEVILSSLNGISLPYEVGSFLHNTISSAMTAIGSNSYIKSAIGLVSSHVPFMNEAFFASALTAAGYTGLLYSGRYLGPVLGAAAWTLFTGAAVLGAVGAVGGLIGAATAGTLTVGGLAAGVLGGAMAGFQLYRLGSELTSYVSELGPVRAVKNLFGFTNSEITEKTKVGFWNIMDPDAGFWKTLDPNTWNIPQPVKLAATVAAIAMGGYYAYTSNAFGVAAKLFDINNLSNTIPLAMIGGMKAAVGLTKNPALLIATLIGGVGSLMAAYSLTSRIQSYAAPMIGLGAMGAVIASSVFGPAALPVGLMVGASLPLVRPLFSFMKDQITGKRKDSAAIAPPDRPLRDKPASPAAITGGTHPA